MTTSRIAGWVAAAAFATALAPPIEPWVDTPLHPLLLGLASGVVLFALLARRRIRLAAVASRRRWVPSSTSAVRTIGTVRIARRIRSSTRRSKASCSR